MPRTTIWMSNAGTIPDGAVEESPEKTKNDERF
jgi:hypothetical protein